jgi:hypothetical protein
MHNLFPPPSTSESLSSSGAAKVAMAVNVNHARRDAARGMAVRLGAHSAPGCHAAIKSREPSRMTIHLELAPIISIVAGILILVRPHLLSYIVAIYLILMGVLQLVGY